jgi:DNA methylase
MARDKALDRALEQLPKPGSTLIPAAVSTLDGVLVADSLAQKLLEHPRVQYPHTKPIGLIARLIGAVTKPGDLVVDPAAGSFVTMHVATEMRRSFVGCDIAYGTYR